jgi:hypothetical protein
MAKRKGTAIHEPGDRKFATLAYLTQHFGLGWRVLREAAEEIALKPDMELNGVAYYSMETAVPKLHCHLVNTGLVRETMYVPGGRVDVKAAKGR